MNAPHHFKRGDVVRDAVGRRGDVVFHGPLCCTVVWHDGAAEEVAQFDPDVHASGPGCGRVADLENRIALLRHRLSEALADGASRSERRALRQEVSAAEAELARLEERARGAVPA